MVVGFFFPICGWGAVVVVAVVIVVGTRSHHVALLARVLYIIQTGLEITETLLPLPPTCIGLFITKIHTLLCDITLSKKKKNSF